MAQEGKSSTVVYEGKDIIVENEPKLCIHSRHCVTNAIKVFKPNVDGPWIDPDAAHRDTVIGVVSRCPSGALRHRCKNGEPQEPPPDVNTIRVNENGPYYVNADSTIQTKDGPKCLHRAALCRCGHSKNKPFCDKSHVEAGFTATGEPRVRDSDPLEKRGGPLKFKHVKDGPLHVKGNVEIIGSSGKTVDRKTSATLCRCGHSNNKPYCDGSHARGGFKG
jgi:CDGSH-type Zn-finger protein/uncharacterized Fe-S cluster protein YjdI